MRTTFSTILLIVHWSSPLALQIKKLTALYHNYRIYKEVRGNETPLHSEIPLILKGKPDYDLNTHIKSTCFLSIFQIIFQYAGNLSQNIKR